MEPLAQHHLQQSYAAEQVFTLPWAHRLWLLMPCANPRVSITDTVTASGCLEVMAAQCRSSHSVDLKKNKKVVAYSGLKKKRDAAQGVCLCCKRRGCFTSQLRS